MSKAELVSFVLQQQAAQAEVERKQSDTIASLERHIKWLSNIALGSRSERRVLDHLDAEGQLLLSGMMLELPKEVPPADTTVVDLDKKGRKKKTKVDDKTTGGIRFKDNVPVIEVKVENPLLAGADPAKLTVIETRHSDRIVALPPFAVLRMVLETTKNKVTGEISRPKVPSGIWDQCCADVSFLAKLVVDKYQFHQPLYRQHQELQQKGVEIHRGTISRYIHRAAELLDPIYGSLLSSILKSKVISMDETPVKAGHQDGKTDKTKKAFYWPIYGDQDEIYFLFSPTRSGKVVKDVLGAFQGTLLSDGYDAYETFANKVEGVTWAACWAHVRRKFIEAENHEPDKVKKLLVWMQTLYKVEKNAGDDRKLRERLRSEVSTEVVDEIFTYLNQVYAESRLPQTSPFIIAINYALERTDGLRVFLSDPAVPIDNNHVYAARGIIRESA